MPNSNASPSPLALTAVVAVASWMTYRILGFVFLGEVVGFGGSAMPTAWVVPLGQDGLIGLTAPIVVFLIATRPRVLTYAIATAWLWWGVVDFIVGLVVENLYPPIEGPFGPHVPDAMLAVWLYGNLLLEIVALGLFLTPAVRRYFTEPERQSVSLTIAESPMRGAWIPLMVAAALMGLFFPQVAVGMDWLFELLGFLPK